MPAKNPFALEERIALVTGASRGIGAAIARALAAAGAHVVLASRSPDALQAMAEGIEADDGRASVAPFDVMDAEAGAAALRETAEIHGRLDILVNNAGTGHRLPLAELSDEEWQRVIGTDLTACFTLSRAAAAIMTPQGHGRIIMITSILGSIARPQVAGYATAKGGLDSLTRALAVELGPSGVTCNGIAPGYIHTELTSALWNDPEFDSKVRQRTPLGRWGEPEEIAQAAVFLASDAAAYVNGAILTIDGGLTAAL